MAENNATFRTIDWKALVLATAGKEYSQPVPVYRFSDGTVKVEYPAVNPYTKTS